MRANAYERKIEDDIRITCMKVLVVGGTGLLGRNILQQLRERSHKAVGTYYSSNDDNLEMVTLDKTDPEQASSVVNDCNPDAIIDTAAYHNVDNCETNRQQAWNVNAKGTGHMAEAATNVNAHYQYISTSFVFDGNSAPYSPQDPVSPKNYYGETKYAGETAAKIAGQWTVVRADVIYGLANANYVTWAISELQSENEIRIVDDQRLKPVYAPDIAAACISIIEQKGTGIYHASGPVTCSRYEFTLSLADAFGFDVDLITPITTEEFDQIASRPQNTSLDSTKLHNESGVYFRSPHEAFIEMGE